MSLIFFDLDGTLCQPHPNYLEVFSQALSEVEQKEGIALPRLYRAWLEALKAEGFMTTASALNCAFNSLGIKRTYNFSLIAERLNAAYISEIYLYDGAIELLNELRASGLKIGIITNGPYDAQLGVIKHLKLDERVDYLFISGDRNIGTRKPDLAIFNYALKVAQKSASEALMVGDTFEKDILPAQQLGMQAVFIDRRDPAKDESQKSFLLLREKLFLLLGR